jgi:hypothetical protein
MKVQKTIKTIELTTTIVFAIALLFFLVTSFQNTNSCPVKGDGKSIKDQTADSLKNRPLPNVFNSQQTEIDDFLKLPTDNKAIPLQTKLISMTGYIFDAKWGGQESCECHVKDKSFFDIHIEIVKDLNAADKTKRIICEVTRYSRLSNSNLTYDYIKSLIGKKVKISGYLFYDEEHKQNAANTSKSQTNVWRSTCWEIHPVFNIEEIK